MDEVEGQIAAFVVEEFLFGEGTVDPDADLFAANVLDSLGMIRLIAFLGERFGATVSPSDITVENFNTLRKAADYVRAARR